MKKTTFVYTAGNSPLIIHEVKYDAERTPDKLATDLSNLLLSVRSILPELRGWDPDSEAVHLENGAGSLWQAGRIEWRGSLDWLLLSLQVEVIPPWPDDDLRDEKAAELAAFRLYWF